MTNPNAFEVKSKSPNYSTSFIATVTFLAPCLVASSLNCDARNCAKFALEENVNTICLILPSPQASPEVV